MACWDCFSTWAFDLLPQKCCYLFCLCWRPVHLKQEDWSSWREVRFMRMPENIKSLHMTSEESFTLLTFNTQQLIHFQDDGVAGKIAEGLVESTEYDIVALTEVFDEGSREIMADKLATDGMYCSAVTRAGTEKFCGLGEDSGLFMVAKYPLYDAWFQRFRGKAAVEDVLANKGVLICIFQVGETHIILAHTHLQAAKAGRHVREMQVLELLLEVKIAEERLRARGIDNYLCLASGDFNITDVSGAEKAGFMGDKNPFGDTDEYDKLMELIYQSYPDAKDCWRIHHPDARKDPGYTFDAIKNTKKAFDKHREEMRLEKIPPEQERLDYIFILHPKNRFVEIECTGVKIDRRDDLSDHWGLAAAFKLHALEEHLKHKSEEDVAGFLPNQDDK